MDTTFLNSLKNSTPVIKDLENYLDADSEMKIIADYLKKHNQHNEYIEVDRIKFLYSPKPKKDGGRYVVFELFKRSDIDKMINNDYDFILTAFYDVWAILTPEQKVIQLDKALCGIDINVMEEDAQPKKKSADSREFVANMLTYGPKTVMEISDLVNRGCVDAIEKRKQDAKDRKKGIVPMHNANEDDMSGSALFQHLTKD